MKSHLLTLSLLAFSFFCASAAVTAQGQTLRIATYNLDADTGGQTGQMGGTDAGPGLIPVLEAIGQEHLGPNGSNTGHAQPLDVLALEELDSNGSSVPLTETFIVNQLNSYYQSIGLSNVAQYAVADASTVDPTTGSTGGGPSGLIYNTKTVADLGVSLINTNFGSNGEAREPMRFKLAPLVNGVAGPAYTDFYVYVDHAKSDGSDPTTSAMRRNVEAQDVRANAKSLNNSLNSSLETAHIVYTGDWNINDSSEQTYQTLIAYSSASPGNAIDTADPDNSWTDSSSASQYWPLLSETAKKLDYRDDLQLVTSPTITLPGVQLVTNTLTPFGNGPSAVTYGKSVTTSTALSDLSNKSTILNYLTTDTDHLPVVADYVVVPPGDMNRDQQVNASDIMAMITALNNLSAYEATTGLSAQQVTLIGDVNGDGKFNSADVQALEKFLAANHGTGIPAPEPASVVLLALAMPAFVRRIRRRR
ncbi:MAG TPA: dockerin type I domain-containing protein [Pirellulales bacterium]|nr:dockerin type I domain-containing protein [Pirellulales bacterium]